MTDVRGDLFDIAGRRGDGVATVKSTVLRPSVGHAGTITPEVAEFQIIDGVLFMPGLDPGPAELRIRMGRWREKWTVSIPDSPTPISFTTLLESYVEFEPGLVSEVLAYRDQTVLSASAADASADRAEGAAMNVESVMANAAAGVRGQVQADADRAVQAAADADADRVAAAQAAAGAALSKAESQSAMGMAQHAQEQSEQAAGASDVARAAAVVAQQRAEAAAASSELPVHTHEVEYGDGTYSLDDITWRAVSGYKRTDLVVRAGFGVPSDGDPEVPDDQQNGDIWLDLNTLKVWRNVVLS